MDADRWRVLKSLYDRVMDLSLPSRRAFAAGLSQPSLAAQLGRLVDPPPSGGSISLAESSNPDEPTQIFLREFGPVAFQRVLQPGDVLQERYQVEEFIGEGGMGEVYRAFDRFSNQTVALKTLRSDLASNPVLAARLRRELQLARRVTHTNICRLYDIGRFGRTDGREVVFLSMELLRGGTLCDRISHRPLPFEEACEIAVQITAGLAAAHAADIIHRDFKSANIFITQESPGSLRAVISDFGVAQEATPVVGEIATSFGLSAVVGTPAYMAPEQLEGKPVTPSADIYSLGVVLFEMLSGRLPVEASSPVGIALQRIREAAPDVRTLAPEVPKRWAMTIASCLQRDPSHRPANAEAVRQMLLGEAQPPRVLPSRRTILIASGAGAVALAASAPFFLKSSARSFPAEAKRHFDLGQEFAKRRTKDNLTQAVAEYERAVKIAPDYGDAYAGLADAYSAMANFAFINPKTGWERARNAAETAVRLDPESGRAIGAQAYVTSIDLARWSRAEPFFRKALGRNPREPLVRLWFGAWLGKRGRFNEALAQVNAGVAQDPASFALHHQRAVELMRARRFPEMLAEAREVVRLQPYEGQAHLILARALEWSGHFEEALASCARAESFGSSAEALSSRGCIQAAAGRLREANELAEKARELWRTTPFETLLLAQQLSRTCLLDDVMAVLNAGYDRMDSTILGAPTSPYFEKWQAEAPFRQFVRRLG